MVFVNFVIFVAFIAIAGGGLGKISTIDESGVKAAEEISEIISALFALMAAILFAGAFFLGLLSACCYKSCWGCVGILVPYSLIAAVLMTVFTGILGSYRQTFYDWTCDASAVYMEEIFDDFVDSNMCSEYCPCNSGDLQTGGYSALTDNTLYGFGREHFDDSFGYIKLMSTAE